jgi:hypothetical protein
MVRRIQTNSIESNLKNISADAELIRELQGQVALLKREHTREFGRYRAGEMTKNAFLRLKRINAAKIDRMNRRIGRLTTRSRINLNRISRMIVMHRATKRTTKRKATRRKTTRRKVKRKVTRRRKTTRKRKTARKRVTRKRTVRRRVTRKRATRRKTTRRRTTRRRTTRRRRR